MTYRKRRMGDVAITLERIQPGLRSSKAILTSPNPTQMRVKVWSSQTRSVGKLSNNRRSMPFNTPNCRSNPAVDSMKKNAETNNRRFHLSS